MLLEKFVNNCIVTATMADKVEREYIQLIQFDIIQEKFKSYNRNKSRLDHFWIEILECVGIENYSNIFSFIKKIMILSHGNVALERSFSINKECLVENQKQQSLIAQRVICDAINAMDGALENYVIDKKLMQEVKMSSAAYKKALLEEKENNEKAECGKMAERRKTVETLELEARKNKIVKEAEKEAIELEKKMVLKKS